MATNYLQQFLTHHLLQYECILLHYELPTTHSNRVPRSGRPFHAEDFATKETVSELRGQNERLSQDVQALKAAHEEQLRALATPFPEQPSDQGSAVWKAG